MNGQMDGQMVGWLDRWDRWMDRWMDGYSWMGRWMMDDGYKMDRCVIKQVWQNVNIDWVSGI